MTSAVDVRSSLLDALRLDLVGPEPGLGNPSEVLNQFPSRWYLTGFLVPTEAKEEQKNDVDADDELEAAGDTGGSDDANEAEKASARRASFPSSVGMSLLVGAETKSLDVVISWGDYRLQLPDEELGGQLWQREHREETIEIPLPTKKRWRKDFKVSNSFGLEIAVALRSVSSSATSGIPAGARSISLFLVNRRTPAPDDTRGLVAVKAEVEQLCKKFPLYPERLA